MSPRSHSKNLMIALKSADHKELIKFSSQNRSKKNDFTFHGALKSLNETEVENALSRMTEMVLQIAENALESGKDATNQKALKKIYTEAQQVILAAIDMASATFEMNLPISNSILHLAVFLNGIIFDIPKCIEGLKNNIAQFCEKIHHQNYVKDRSNFFTYNAIIYLLIRSLSLKATKSDVKRVYVLRKIIPTVLQMKEVDKQKIWALLKRCAVSKLYVGMPEGLKVISMSLTLDPSRIADIHNVIRSRLATVPLKAAIAYGKMYFEAWTATCKSNDENLKDVFEITCIEDLLLLAINAQSKSLVVNIRKLLNQIHCHKKENYVTEMLYNFYQPLLWRYLRNYDGIIRSNATQLFLDVFPIANPDLRVVSTDLHLNEQLLMIKDLLVDDYPIVRCSAIIGLCIAMSVNWELFPEEMLKTYFKILVSELSHDSSSVEVRCSVAKGIKVLLENPLIYPTLQKILPKLQHLFHDYSETVRVAFCQVLLRVKRISCIKYFDIVPPEHLLAQMEVDCHAVTKTIVNILCNSYFPRNANLDERLIRCVNLIRKDLGASRVFFRHVPSLVDTEILVSVMIQAVKAIHFYVSSKEKINKMCPLSNSDYVNSTKKKLSALEERLNFQDVNTVSGVFDCIAIMWIASEQQLEQQHGKFLLKLLVAKLKRYLPDLLIYYKDTIAWESLYYLSSYMPSSDVQSLSSLCYFQLKALSSDTDPQKYMTLLESLCNQNAAIELMQMLREWINFGIDDIASSPSAKRRRSSAKKSLSTSNSQKNSLSTTNSQPKPYLAVKMIRSMLNHRSCQKSLIETCTSQLLELLSSVNMVKEKIASSDEKSLTADECDFLKELLLCLTKIAIFMHDMNKFDALLYFEELTSWFLEKMWKRLQYSCESVSLNERKRKSKRKSKVEPVNNLATLICKDICLSSSDVTLLGIFDVKKFVSLKFACKLLQLDSAPAFILPVAKVFGKHVFISIVFMRDNQDYTLWNALPSYFSEIIECLKKEQNIDCIPTVEIKNLHSVFEGTIELLYNHKTAAEEFFKYIQPVVESLLSIFTDFTKTVVEQESCESFEKIPISKRGAFFYSIVISKPKLISLYLKSLYQILSSSEMKIDAFIASWVILWNILQMKNLSHKTFVEITKLVTLMKESLNKMYPPGENEQNFNNEEKDFEDENMQISTDERFGYHCRSELKKLEPLLSKWTNKSAS